MQNHILQTRHIKLYFSFIIIFIIITRICASDIQRLSLVIGNNYGLYNDTPLKYAINDAKKFYQVLSELGGIESARNYLLLNQKKQKIIETFYEIKGRIKEIKNNGQNVFIHIFYSGHADPSSLHIEGEKLPLEDVKEFFNTIDADLKIMIVDACYSGSLLREKGIRIGAPIDISILDQLKTKGSVIISSSSSRELSHESEELQGSLFSHYWISALRGAADFNKDKQISLLEAYNYANSKTIHKINQSKSTSQRPAFDIDLVGQKDVMLTSIENGKTVINFSNCDSKTYTIISSRTYDILAEVNPAPDELLSIALPKDNYLIQKKTEKYLYIKNIDLTWNSEYNFSPDQMKMYPLESVTKKGRFNWHFTPYHIMIRMKTRKDIITGSKQLIYPQLVFKYNYRNYIISFMLSYHKEKLTGSVLNIDRRSWESSILLSNRIYHNYLYIVDGGIEFGGIWINQKPERKDENNIQQMGYPPLPDYKSFIYHIGYQQNNTFIFQYGILLNIQFGINLNIYKDPGKSKTQFSYPLVIGIGKRF